MDLLTLTHPAFQGSKIRAVKESQIAACKNASSIACRHGTFVAGILCAKRGLSAPAICPGCTLLLRPIFMDETATIIAKVLTKTLCFLALHLKSYLKQL